MAYPMEFKVNTKTCVKAKKTRLRRKFIFFFEHLMPGIFVMESAGELSSDYGKNLTPDEICRKRHKRGTKKIFDYNNSKLYIIEITDWAEEHQTLFESNKINKKGEKRTEHELHVSIQSTIENTYCRKHIKSKGYFIERTLGREVHGYPEGKTIDDAVASVNKYLFDVETPRIFKPKAKTTDYLFRFIRQVVSGEAVRKEFLYGIATGAGKTADFLFGCAEFKKLTGVNVNFLVTSIPDTRIDLCKDVRDGVPFQKFIIWVPDKHLPEVQWILKDRVRPLSEISDINNMPDKIHVISLGVQDARGDSGKKYKDILTNFTFGLYGKDEVHTNQKDYSQFAKNVEPYLKFTLAVYMTGTPEQFVLEYSKFTEENRHLFLMEDVYLAQLEGDPDWQNIPWRNIMVLDYEGAQRAVAKLLGLEDFQLHTLSKQWAWDKTTRLFVNENAIRELIKIRFGVGIHASDSRCFWGPGSGLANCKRKVGVVCIEAGEIKAKGLHLKKIIEEEVDIKAFSAHESKQAYEDWLNFCANTNEDCVYITHDKDMTGKNNPYINWGWFSLNINSITRANQGLGRFIRKLLDKITGKNLKPEIYPFFDNPQTALAITADPIDAISNNPGSTHETAVRILKTAAYWLEGSEVWKKATPVDLVKHIHDIDPLGARGLSSTRHIDPHAICPSHLNGNLSGKKVINSAGKNISTVTSTLGKNRLAKGSTGSKTKTPDKIYIENLNYSIKKLVNAVVHCDYYVVRDILSNPVLPFDNEDIPLQDICGPSLSFIDILDALNNGTINEKTINRSLAKVRANYQDLYNNGSIEEMLEYISDLGVHDERTNFVPEGLEELEIEVRKVLQQLKDNGITKHPTILEPCAGRMTMLYLTMKFAPEYDIDIDPKKCYYNDIDITWWQWAKKINEVYKLGIPEENFWNIDAKEIKMKDFDLIITNLPLQTVTVSHKDGKENRQPQWQELCEHFVTLLKPGTGVYHAIQSRNGHSDSATNKINKVMENNTVSQLECNVNHYFSKQKIKGDFVSLTIQNKKNDPNIFKIVGVDGVEFDYDFKKYGFIPFMITEDLYNVFDKFISYKDKFTSWKESRENAPKTRGDRLLFISGRNGHYIKRIIATNKDEDVPNVQYSLMLTDYTNVDINYEVLEKNLQLPIYRFIYDFLGANRGQSRTWILRKMPVFKDMFTKEITIDEHFNLLGITKVDGEKILNYLSNEGSLGNGKL